MAQAAYKIRAMTQADLSTCLSFTQAVKWPHQLHDWQLHFDLGNGSVVVDQEDNVVGTILWWDFGANYATVGLVVVPDHMQGNGLGRKLMNAVMEQAGSRNLQLVATLAGKRLYEQCGFVEVGEIYQIQGTPNNRQAEALPEGVVCKGITDAQLAEIIALDNTAYQAERNTLITALLKQGPGVCLYQEDKLIGYGFVRDSGRGQTIGPIIANTDQSAIYIAAALLEKTTGFVRFDLTEQGAALKAWTLSLDLEQVDAVCLMVKGEYLPNNDDSLFNYALTSQALG